MALDPQALAALIALTRIQPGSPPGTRRWPTLPPVPAYPWDPAPFPAPPRQAFLPRVDTRRPAAPRYRGLNPVLVPPRRTRLV